MALEMMIVGLRMSKSALAQYGEQCGVVVTFLFDAVVFQRQWLRTDYIAVALITCLQARQACESVRKAGQDISSLDDKVKGLDGAAPPINDDESGEENRDRYQAMRTKEDNTTLQLQ